MKRLPFLLAVLMLLSYSNVSAQGSIAAKVTEVVDGRTLIIETATGRVTAQLQYIEVPEPEQALHATIREHLTKLAAGQTGEFRAVRVLDGRTVGRFTISGVDLSLQLIRDGAAWHEPIEMSGQDAAQAEEYARNQELAKSEKRGVWSVVGLKAPWLLREERDAELDRQAALKRKDHSNIVVVNQFQTVSRPGMKKAADIDFGKSDVSAWSFPFSAKDGGEEGSGVRAYADPNGRFSAVYSSPVLIDFDFGGKKHRMECRIVHYSANLVTRESWYAIFFRSVSGSYAFRGRNNLLTLSAGRKILTVGRPYAGASQSSMYAEHEIFFYRTGQATMSAIASGGDARFRIDSLSGNIPTELSLLAKDLVAATK